VVDQAAQELSCPLCGEPLDVRADNCENCGASIPKQVRDELKLLMKKLNISAEQAQRLFNLGYKKPEDLKGKDIDDVLKEEPKLFMCPECGAFVQESEDKCSRCEAEFAGEAVEIEEYLLREERPCPHCGESIHKDAETCPSCGKSIIEEAGVSLGSTYLCPTCGVTVLEGQKECEVCGTDLSPTSLITSKALEIAVATCPNCGASLESETEPCPYCTKEEVGEEAEEVMEEIDKFLEQLATMPTAREKARAEVQRALTPSVEKPLEKAPPISPKVEIPVEKTEVEKVRPVEEVVEKGLEVETEVALEELEAGVKELPMIKLLKPSKAKIPSKAPPLRISAESGGLANAAETILYATGVGLSLQYFVATTGNIAFGWALFVFFGFAWGMAIGIIVLASKSLKQSLKRSWQTLLGTLIILIVPLHWYLDLAWPQEIDFALVIIGIALWTPLIVRGRGRARWRVVWAGGSTISIVLMPATVLSINLGGDIVTAFLWFISAFLVLFGIAFALHIRWLHWSLDLSLRRGEEEFARREFGRSVEDYDRAIDIARRSGEEDVATPWYSKGAALVILGQYEDALKAIDEALKINPNNEIAWINKGNALSRMGDYKGALKAFNAALRANPRYEVAWNNKGNTLARLGKYKESLKCYDLALQIDPYYRGAWVNRGFVLARIGEFEEAAKCAEKVMVLSGSFTG